ncbi:hypothetical protein C5167_026575 [Papaver somniferum]|nr:hypothetical protein C5167_026575 [Papaver somniferum]
MVLSNDIDLLNPKPDLEKRRHKLKRLVQSQTPSSCSTIVFLLACLPVNETASHSVFCDGTFFPSLHDEMSAIVGCFNRRAQNLLQVHLSSGFRKYFTWIKRKLVKGNHVAMVEEGKKGLLHIFAGYAVGGGHVLHMVCDLTIAADNAVFGQTGPKVGSLDAGYGSSIMSRLVGPKKAREMWFLARFYNASEAEKMGLVNVVVPAEQLYSVTHKQWLYVEIVKLSCANQLEVKLDLPRDAHSGEKEIKRLR